MKAEIFTIKYADKHAAAIVYQKVSQLQDDIGIIACGLERSHSRSRRIRTYLKLNIVLENERAKDLPSILKVVHNSLVEHPLYSYLSFDYIAIPTSQTEWNFHSYDDPNWQKIFIQKRTKG
jgi:hypothetical protein